MRETLILKATMLTDGAGLDDDELHPGTQLNQCLLLVAHPFEHWVSTGYLSGMRFTHFISEA